MIERCTAGHARWREDWQPGQTSYEWFHCDLPKGHLGQHSENGATWPDISVMLSEVIDWQRENPSDLADNPWWGHGE